MRYVNVEGAIRDTKKLSHMLTGKQLAIGISRGINSTLRKGRTEARAAVKAAYNIPQKNLTGININRSFPKTLTGSIYASARPIPMDAFAPKFETPTKSISVSKKGVQKVKDRKRAKKNPGKGVSIEVIRGSREVVPFAFMIKGAKPRVFARGQYRAGGTAFGFVRRNTRVNKVGNDTPIKPLISITVHGAVINDKSIGRISDRIERDFPNDLAHELKHLASKLPK